MESDILDNSNFEPTSPIQFNNTFSAMALNKQLKMSSIKSQNRMDGRINGQIGSKSGIDSMQLRFNGA